MDPLNRVIFDIESDGLLDTISKIHCVSIIHLDKGTKQGEPMLHLPHVEGADGLGLNWAAKQILQADLIIGHNIIGFDIPAIEKVGKAKPTWPPVYDTLIASRLMFPNIETISRHIPTKLMTSHSLEAWGHRLRLHKGDYKGGWEKYSPEMGEYCMQDTLVTKKLYEFLQSQNWSEKSISIEMRLAVILSEAERHGMLFDMKKAEEFYNMLIEKRFLLKEKTRALFKPWYQFKSLFTYKKTGATVSKIELVEFNPGSRTHITNRLINKYKWDPVDYTDKGNIILNDEILNALPYPEAKVLTELMTIQKRIAQLAEGKQAWMAVADRNHRIHCRINQNGALTGRATHSSPNLAQVPAPRTLYGDECRSLFIAPKDKVLVGVDLSGLELRCLAGYIKSIDGGAAVHNILYSTKNVDDIYTLAGKSCNMDRNTGKTLILAMMYGSGDKKLGAIADPTLQEEQLRRLGRSIRTKVSDSLEGYQEFTDKVKALFRERGTKKAVKDEDGNIKYEYVGGWIAGLCGRKLYPAFEYSTLNTLIQGAGAVISKQWILETIYNLELKGLTHGKEFTLVGWVHDEQVIECDPDKAELVLEVCLKAAEQAGEFFKFPCPIAAEGKIGQNWLEIH